MAAGWLHKVRTGSGSDRVVSEMLDYAGHYKIWPYWKKRNDSACVSTRSLPLPVLTLCSRAVLYPSPFAFSHNLGSGWVRFAVAQCHDLSCARETYPLPEVV